jgi:DNA polymerase III subunit gamma/tau
MSYLVLARKYRPQKFGSVIAQDHVVRSLKNAILRDKVAHAYLFTGTRGVGKTSVARIFSRALNCEQLEQGEPCQKCSVCLEISKGASLGVWEIDGASHNSVDNVRELIDTFRLLPPPGYRYKIYIIDEVHMLSTAAFNALLKSLEEPPANTVFILATTEVHKIPDTILSRCQRFDFRSLSVAQIVESLQTLVQAEGINIDSDALNSIARLADGSARDAQTLLDRVYSFAEAGITAELVSEILGVTSLRSFFDLSQSIISKDSSASLAILDRIFSVGADCTIFARDFAAHWRALLLAKFGGPQALNAVGMPEHDMFELTRQVNSIDASDLQELVRLALQGCDSAVRASNTRYALEALVVKMATRPKIVEFAKVLAAVRKGITSGAERPVVSHSPASKAAVSAAPQRTIDVQEAPSANKSASAPHLASSNTQSTSRTDLDWGAFVEYAVKNGPPVLSEHLKRLGSIVFQPGKLTLKGAEFSIAYFRNKPEREKLDHLLVGFSGHSDWQIDLQAGSSLAKPEPGSVMQVQASKIQQDRREKSQNLLSHPQVKSLQKLFPGSKIEKIKLTE